MTDRPELWLPPGAATFKNPREQRPFKQLGDAVRKIGFECMLRRDVKARTVEIEFRPTTQKTLRAVRRAADDQNIRALRVAATYDLPSEEGQAVVACIEHGIRQLKDEVL